MGGGVEEEEVLVPGAALRFLHEIEQGVLHPGHCGDRGLARSDTAEIGGRPQRIGALDGAGGIVQPQGEGADAGAVHEVEGMGEAVLLAVDHDIDVVLAEQVHILRAMARHAAKAQPLQLRHKARRMGGAGDEFDELHARHFCGGGQGAADGQRGRRGFGAALVQRLAADLQ